MSPETLLALISTSYFGAAIGGFTTVLYPRLGEKPAGSTWRENLRRLSAPGSSCRCGRLLGPLEKQPVIGWFLSRKGCPVCGCKAPPGYLMAELCAIAGLLVMTAHFWPGNPLAYQLQVLPGAALILAAILIGPVFRRFSCALLIGVAIIYAALQGVPPAAVNGVDALPIPALIGTGLLFGIAMLPAKSPTAGIAVAGLAAYVVGYGDPLFLGAAITIASLAPLLAGFFQEAAETEFQAYPRNSEIPRCCGEENPTPIFGNPKKPFLL